MNNELNIALEKVEVNKQEYDYLKSNFEYYRKFEHADFALVINRGAVIPKFNPNYYNNRIDIEIFCSDFANPYEFNVNINGKEFNDKKDLLPKIKDVINKNINALIILSMKQTNDFIFKHSYEGGIGGGIAIKYGSLKINISAQINSEDIEIINSIINEITSLFE